MEILSILQVIVSVLLVVSILLQERGTGVSSVFGGEGGYYLQKRGMEKVLFWSSVSLSVLFFGLAIASFLV